MAVPRSLYCLAAQLQHCSKYTTGTRRLHKNVQYGSFSGLHLQLLIFYKDKRVSE